MKLLTVGNPKTAKGVAKGYLTSILHFAPARLSGFNVCPKASEACTIECLNTAGRGGIFPAIQEARKRKTLLYFNEYETFMIMLVKDVKAAIRKAEKDNLTPVFRLNGTSDIRWENSNFTFEGKEYANIMEMFPNVTFYDYTKISNRRNLPANYSLTFSRSESNETEVKTALDNGMNVAVVFSTKKGAALPETWNGYTVIDGDETDLRFLDPKGVIVGLRAKGKARKNTNGFVVNV